MSNPLQTGIFPKEIWNLILDKYSDFSSLIVLSQVDKRIGKLASLKLKNIKFNINELYKNFYKIQDLYTIKYRNIDRGDIDVADLGKNVLLEIEINENLIHCKRLQTIHNNLIDLKENQIIVIPVFGHEESGKFLPENNPYYPPFGIGLDSRADSIAQDRLPIKEIKIKSKISDPPHLLIAIKLAVDKVNKQFYKMNGSYLDAFKARLPSQKEFQ